MFEHLDDPVPFRPDARLRTAVVRDGRRRRNRRRTAVSAASVGVPMAVLAGTVGAVRWKADQARPVSVGSVPQTEADGRPAELNLDDLTKPFTLLAVGTDGGGRTDTIMVIEVDRPAGSIRLVSVPRDLWLPLGDGSGPDKINTALNRSRETLIKTVNQALGVTIDHYLEIGMDGFAPVVDAAGGIPVVIETPLRDERSGLYLDAAGCQTLDGTTALALARSRYLAVRNADGTWTTDTSTDIGRAARQQVLAAAAIARAGHLRSPEALLPLGNALAHHLRGDQELDVRQSGELTMWAGTLGPDAFRSMTVPTVEITADGKQVLELTPGAPAEVRRFLAGEPAGAGTPAVTAPGGAPVQAHLRAAPGGTC